MLFGALAYNTSSNLGDNVQTLAAIQYLPSVDVWVDRDSGDITYLDSSEPKDHEIFTIYNGWFNIHFWKQIPTTVTPIFFGFHLQDDDHRRDISYNCIQKYRVVPNNKNIEKIVGSKFPVYSRDFSTQNYLQDLGVMTKFAACLTLTFKPSKDRQSKSGILVIDVDMSIPWIAKLKDVKYMTQHTTSKSNEEKLKQARNLLDAIESSKLVITSRLHSALPSISYKTPVILVTRDSSDIRFSGFLDYIPNCSNESKVPPVDLDTFNWDVMKKEYHIDELIKLAVGMAKILLDIIQSLVTKGKYTHCKVC